MARTKIVDGVEVPLTAGEEAARDAEEAQWAVDNLAITKAVKRDAAIIQYKVRAFAVTGTEAWDQPSQMGKAMKWLNRRAKGTSTAQEDAALDALDAQQDQVDTLRDKLNLLFDAIEAAADQAAVEAIDVTADSWWV